VCVYVCVREGEGGVGGGERESAGASEKERAILDVIHNLHLFFKTTCVHWHATHKHTHTHTRAHTPTHAHTHTDTQTDTDDKDMTSFGRTLHHTL